MGSAALPPALISCSETIPSEYAVTQW